MSSLQSALIVQMQQGHALRFLVTLSSQSLKGEFKDWNLITLDILHLICRNVKAEQLVKSVAEIRNNNLADLLGKEERTKKADLRKGASRHSRFGTTMAVEAVRSYPHLTARS
jgi:replication fork protection complex subunit Tof1/Swi1